MPPGMALIVTLRGSNYRCLEQIFMVPNGFEPSKFDCIFVSRLPIPENMLLSMPPVCMQKSRSFDRRPDYTKGINMY